MGALSFTLAEKRGVAQEIAHCLTHLAYSMATSGVSETQELQELNTLKN